MSLDFKIIRNAVITHFDEMCRNNQFLFTIDLDKDKLWELYLNSIPAEDNKIFRVRREFDCSCCRHFIKSFGNVVAIKDNNLVSVWDFETSDDRWNMVAKELSKYVKSFPVTNVFLSIGTTFGTDYNMDNKEIENPIKWEHFFVEVPKEYVFRSRYRDTLDTKLGEYRDSRNVFKRSLEEFSLETIDTVLDLINQGSLYKGDEYKDRIVTFRKLRKEYDNAADKDLFTWEKSVSLDPAISRIRNTAIGTLLIDISEDLDLEEAVRKYEAVTAPSNYKRSKPVFTKRMLEDAQKTITELGYLNSLERRYANADDITVNNILFSNKDTAKRIQGGASGLFEELAKETSGSPKKFDRVEEIPIDKFINDVLPTVSEVKAYVEGKHMPNFMSLIAPVHPDSKTMFKWNNNFSWAYAGNVTDSIVKQNVKNAGGKVDGVLRFSIQWNDTGEWDRNDEDAHCIEPNGNHIYFRNKVSLTHGNLDVDIIDPQKDVPAVENITWPDIRRMEEGVYKFFVHCYSCRGGRSGFRAEIEFNGQIYAFDYSKPLRQDEKVQVAEVTLKNGQFTIKGLLPSNCSSREVWGIKTNEFTPVTVICYSPNYWDEQSGIGNKHYFFMLKNCVNPELPNAWYNEFLNSELYPNHRKVMEALGSKAHVVETDDQLSGIGFSSTIRNDLVVKIKGATERVLKIKF